MKKIRVAIADDHPLTRQGIKSMLSESDQFEVTAEYETTKSLMQQFAPEQGDVLVLDVHFGDGDGLDVLTHLKAQRKDLSVLMLSYHTEEQYALRALKAGANGYLCKSAPAEELIQALTILAAGGAYLGPKIAANLAMQALQDGNRQVPHETLSNREFQVLCLIGAGKSHKEIAEKLSINVKTVSTFKARISEKMNLPTTAAMIAYVIERQLVYQ